MDDRRDVAINEILELLLKSEWRVGRSHREFAERYGVSVPTVRGWAAEAARFLRMCRGNEEEFREKMLADLDEIADRCRDNVKTFYANDTGEARLYPSPDYRNWISAIELRARVYGITSGEGTKRGGGSGDPMQVPVEELEAVLKTAGYRIEKVSDDNGGSTDGGEQAKPKRRRKAADEEP